MEEHVEERQEGGNLARTTPTSNPDPDQEQGGLGVWCGVNRQRAERPRALVLISKI